jgi:hypothetical protein
MAQSIAAGFVNGCQTEDAFLRAMLDPSNAAGTKWQQMSIQTASRELRGLYQEAQAWIGASPPLLDGEAVVDELKRFQAIADS